MIVIDSDEMTKITYSIKLIDPNGRIADIGHIDFTRFLYDEFFTPIGHLVYQGAPVSGCGIFFITALSNGVRGEEITQVYELAQEMNVWNLLEESDFYVPVVYAHGRGDQYLLARSGNPTMSLPNPVKLQERNLLTGAFYSYFTTDGESYSFTIPYKNLTDEAIGCRFETARDYFREWVIEEGEEASDPIELMSEQVTMHCNRNTGRIYFTGTGGAVFPLLYNGILNNLCFTCYKTDADDRLKVSSMTVQTYFSGNTAGGSTGQLICAGSFLFPSELLWFDPHNPLYFPKSCTAALGDDRKRVLALTSQGRALLAFKEDELYAGRLYPTERANLEMILRRQVSAGQYGEDQIRFSRAAELPARPIGKTVSVVNGRTLFALENARIFAASGSSAESVKITELSGDINRRVREPVWAVSWDGRYLLFGRDGCVALDCRSGDLSSGFGRWYRLTFPADITAGLVCDGSTVLCGRQTEGITKLFYTLTMWDGPDRVLEFESDAVVVKEYERSGMLCLAQTPPTGRKYRLYGLRADVQTDHPFTVCLSDRKRPLVQRRFACSCESVTVRSGGYFREPVVQILFHGPMVYRGCELDCLEIEKL